MSTEDHFPIRDLLFHCYIFIYLFSAVLGFELRAFTLSHSTSPVFVKGFLEIGSHNLFARAGFELRSF
jgi:hypothetical protein